MVVVIAEQLILCLGGLFLGIAAAFVIEPQINNVLVGYVGDFEITRGHVVAAFVAAVGVAVVISLIPIMQLSRLDASRAMAFD